MDKPLNFKVPKKDKSKTLDTLFEGATNPMLQEEVINLLKNFTFAEAERIPELRNLMQAMLTLKEERTKIAESIGVMSYEDTQRLFRDYMEDIFDASLQKFFDRLYQGILEVFRSSLGRELSGIRDEMRELKSTFLYGAMSPWHVMEYEVARTSLEFIRLQPNQAATVHAIYTQLAFTAHLPIPGNTTTEKTVWVVKVLRSIGCLKEYEGFLFEIDGMKYKEDSERYAAHYDYQGMLERKFPPVQKSETEV